MPAKRLSPFDLLKHRRRYRTVIGVLLTLAVVVLILVDRSGGLLVAGDDLTKYDGQTFTVVRVIDGDTFDLAIPDGEHRTTRVRLWGVDTPERARKDLGHAAEPFSRAATDFTTELIEGHNVILRLEPHRTRGNYGRLLAHVELSGAHSESLNERLLLAGLARADNRWSHRHVQRYALLELQAQREGKGLWSRTRR